MATMTTKRTPIHHRERLDYPMPWESRPVSCERWRKHRERLLAECHVGRRPHEWWTYEKGCRPPEKQTQALYTMGELRADELAKLTQRWREVYEEAVKQLVRFITWFQTRPKDKRRDRHRHPPTMPIPWNQRPLA